MSKKSLQAAVAVTDSITPEEHRAVLRAIYDKVDREPPVGERYDFLVKDIIRAAIADTGLHLTPDFHESLVADIFKYVASLGPIQPYLEDPAISEIMVNGPNQVFI